MAGRGSAGHVDVNPAQIGPRVVELWAETVFENRESEIDCALLELGFPSAIYRVGRPWVHWSSWRRSGSNRPTR
ncbi:MAG: hypothetical protein GY820_41590 [Gammaproteobacteria bacterium]|nr:hypothetical protein [Gammaproteobacteria bacterium]